MGIHLLLASQRLEEGRLRGLESHLSYRVGLRTFSAGESRTVLGVPDAYELPAVPGLGFLKPDQSTLLRFKAAYVSGPPSGRTRVVRDEGGHVRGILPFTISEVQALEPLESEVVEEAPVVRQKEGEQPSLLDLAVSRMEGHGTPAHQVWLPPLDVPDTLDVLMPDLVEDPDLGLVSPHWRSMGGLVVPLGTVDRPREQRRDTMTLNLTGAAGHVAVVGGPRSGKSTMLRSVVTSMSLTTTPLESQFFVLDFGGGTFTPLARLPHVAGVGTRAEPDVVRRIFAEVTGIVDRREAYFREQSIDSIETYRSRRAAGRADDGYGDVFLVVDGWGTLRAEFDDLELEIQQLAGRGLTFGLHLLVGATRWADFRAAMRDMLGIAARAAARRPARLRDRPQGRGSSSRPADPAVVWCRASCTSSAPCRASTRHPDPEQPRRRCRRPDRAQRQGLARPARAEAAAAARAHRPRDDPARTPPAATSSASSCILGINEKELAPATLDTDGEPHLLIFGDGQSGKSALLRNYVQEIMRTRTPKEAQIVVVDYRRSLLGEVPDEYLLNYLTSSTQATPVMQEISAYLQNRIPGPDVTPEQLRTRTWWTGAEVYVVIDDYDLVATSQGSPVQVLQPLMAQARDIGLHVVVARRAGGASRALYDPVIQSMRDLAMPGVMLSGPRDEGVLIGNVRPQQAEPGRARLVTRDRGTEVVQLAWTEPTM